MMRSNSLVHQKQSERFNLLYSLYRRSNSNSDYVCNFRELAQEEGFNYKMFKSAFDYLCHHRLVGIRTRFDERDHNFYCYITEEGIRAIENVFRNENETTYYFPAYRQMM